MKAGRNRIVSAHSLFFDSLNLNDHAILDDDANFAVSNSLYGLPNMVQVRVAQRY